MRKIVDDRQYELLTSVDKSKIYDEFNRVTKQRNCSLSARYFYYAMCCQLLPY